jgi:hypothetical protein
MFSRLRAVCSIVCSPVPALIDRLSVVSCVIVVNVRVIDVAVRVSLCVCHVFKPIPLSNCIPVLTTTTSLLVYHPLSLDDFARSVKNFQYSSDPLRAL